MMRPILEKELMIKLEKESTLKKKLNIKIT